MISIPFEYTVASPSLRQLLTFHIYPSFYLQDHNRIVLTSFNTGMCLLIKKYNSAKNFRTKTILL